MQKVCIHTGQNEVDTLKYYLKIIVCIALLFLTVFGCASIDKSTTGPDENAAGAIVKDVFSISEIDVYPRTFNPSKGEQIRISFHVSQPGKALVQIFDPDMFLVKEILTEVGNPGRYDIIWDGRDMAENVVPDEAYFFTIEANNYPGDLTYYDPITFYNMETMDFPVEFQKSPGTIAYELPMDARVTIRSGISDGPMLKVVANGVPRPAGPNVESWDGRDESRIVNITEQEKDTILTEGISLPENSIFSIGNKNATYFDYKNVIAPDRPEKESRPRSILDARGPDYQFVQPTQLGVNLKFRLEVTGTAQTTDDGLPVVGGKQPIKIHIDDQIKRYVTEQRYEILYYVDFGFVAEQEEGYSPCTWIWDTSKLPDGEHILTVNIATLTGDLASQSIKVFVLNQNPL